MDDGDGRVGARRVSVAAARSADGCDDRLYVRPDSDYHGGRAAVDPVTGLIESGHLVIGSSRH